MSDKDINIHVKAQDIPQTKIDFEDVGKSIEDVGKKIADGNKQAADSTEKLSQKTTDQSNIVDKLVTGVKSYVLAWLSIEGVKKAINWFIEKLEKIRDLQKEIHETTTDYAKIGQSLVAMTGTVGKEQEYAKLAAGITQKGGFENKNISAQMLRSAQTSFKNQKGIDNPQVISLLNEMAPVFGAYGFGEEEIKAFMDIAEKAKTPMTGKSYKTLFAQLKTTADVSKTEVKETVINFQSATAAFMSQGGSPEVAEKLYASVRSVTGDDAAAASIFEQTTKLSEGGYEKPRRAIERKFGVKWKDLNADQRAELLVKYIQNLPEGKAEQILEKEGFPSRGRFNLMATPEAREAFAVAEKQTTAASDKDIEPVVKDYLASTYTQERQQISGKELKGIDEDFSRRNWELRYSKFKTNFDTLEGRAKERKYISDEWEPLYDTFTEMATEAQSIVREFGNDSEIGRQARELMGELAGSRAKAEIIFGGMLGASAEQEGLGYENRLAELKKQAQQKRLKSAGIEPSKATKPEPPETKSPVPISSDFKNNLSEDFNSAQQQTIIHNNWHNDMSTHFYPSVGQVETQRFTLDD